MVHLLLARMRSLHTPQVMCRRLSLDWHQKALKLHNFLPRSAMLTQQTVFFFSILFFFIVLGPVFTNFAHAQSIYKLFRVLYVVCSIRVVCIAHYLAVQASFLYLALIKRCVYCTSHLLRRGI